MQLINDEIIVLFSTVLSLLLYTEHGVHRGGRGVNTVIRGISDLHSLSGGV